MARPTLDWRPRCWSYSQRPMCMCPGMMRYRFLLIALDCHQIHCHMNVKFLASVTASALGLTSSTMTPYSIALAIYGKRFQKGCPRAFTIRDGFQPSLPPMLVIPHNFFPLSSKTTSKASILSVKASLLSFNNLLPSSPSASRMSNWLTRRGTTVRSSMRASCLPMQP